MPVAIVVANVWSMQQESREHGGKREKDRISQSSTNTNQIGNERLNVRMLEGKHNGSMERLEGRRLCEIQAEDRSC